MKKLLIAGTLVFLGTLTFSSCIKDYTCEYPDPSNVTTGTSKVVYSDISRAQAKAKEKECEAIGGKWSRNGISGD